MKHILILTSYTNKIRWNNYGKYDYGDYSSINHLEYSNKHGYSYVKKLVNDEDYIDWHPTWIKIDVIKTYLPIFEYVVWIDSDAVFYNQDIKIEESKLKSQLQIHEGDNQNQLEEFWSKVTKIPKYRFQKTIIRPVGNKTGKTKGTCKTRYSNKETFKKLAKMLDDLLKLIENEK